MSSEKNKWRFWIDCGGTFTDLIAVGGNGDFRVHKLLSHSPHYKSAVVQGIRDILGDCDFSEVLEEVRLGTTVATNAFLERKGVPCALVTTLGQRDVLEIRQQNRPKLFDLDIQKQKPLYSYVTHIQGRMDSEGNVIEDLDLDIAEFELKRILDEGIKSVAISLMHATVNPAHEKELGKLAEKLGFEYVSLSHRVSPVAKYIPRAETSVLDAYISPYLEQYTEELKNDLGIENIYYMKSDGGLCQSDELKGHNALLSGPAGGLVGAVNMAREKGYEKIITFDMGGTSTDVAIYDGELFIDHEPEFHGLHFLASMVDIHTVAAGGGSLLKYDHGRFVVGPESAGAYPGPACYRNGGDLTVTDANLFLGRIEAQKFPKVFGKNQNLGPDLETVKTKFQKLSQMTGLSPEEVAEGFLDVAVETMSRAIRKISIERGRDPRDYCLVSFGGAGGQLASRVAENLGGREVLIPPMASVLSAYGIGTTSLTSSLKAKFSEGFESLEKRMGKKLKGQKPHLTHYYLLKSSGSLHEVPIRAESWDEAVEKFRQYYRETFGVTQTEDVECETIVLKAQYGKHESLSFPKTQKQKSEGPEVISQENTSIVLDRNWVGSLDEKGMWALTTTGENKQQKKRGLEVEIEIYYQRFQFIAEQMGLSLKRLAQSVNIKERNDFSCALFNAKGELLSNAPHIPVHLGSMGDAVRAVKESFEVCEGESYITNDPHQGGTHLPDITVVTPVFYGGKLSMWLASRGHHADIGGITPGSMPGRSQTLGEEGVVLAPTRIVKDGTLDEELLKKLLSSGAHPSRNIPLNIHDIKAKLAANQKGVGELEKLFSSSTPEHVFSMAEALMDYSHKKIEKILADFKECQAKKTVTDERVLAVSMKKEKQRTVFDFAGTSKALANNFNAPLPVVKASVLFALRCLIKEGIPLNDGILRGVEIRVPQGSLLNPPPGAAVVAGNVETSQVICDLLFEALKVKANSQGTMNNLSFGNQRVQYYETLGGGSGASTESDGASAVQVNMTNSLLTDPEVFESHYPVLIELMGRRHGSGGRGKFRGGDGLYRRLHFLESMDVSMLSQFRFFRPSGIEGGESGACGRNTVESGSQIEELPECFEIRVSAGDRLSVETPGGGGAFSASETLKPIVFSFGSNMDLVQIQKRCPSAKLLGRAHVQDVEFRYTRFSEVRKGGVADMFHTRGKRVWGLLVELDDEDLEILDEIECKANAYQRVQTEAIDDNGKAWKVYAYDVIDKKPDIPPTKVYEWLVYSGALQINAPHFYLQHIKDYREG